jgi:type I restriction enzyme S subunit
MQYLQIPQRIASKEVLAKGFSWSPSMYKCVDIPTQKTKPVSELIAGYDKGSDPGSRYYLQRSTHYLIRTKALQDHSALIYPKGDAITPMNPRAFEDLSLSDGDILLSKDSNIGECAMVDGDRWKNYAISGGLVRLRPSIDRFYLFAFLKHSLFREELYAMVPRGATIAHANTLWLDCKIPFPDQPDAECVVRYVSALMEAIVDKERSIRERNDAILQSIAMELDTGQRNKHFRYEYPQLDEARVRARFDAAIYSREYKSKMWLMENYGRGCRTPTQAGFIVKPGPSLEIKILRTRIDSNTPKRGFYTLLIPANISEYGTMCKVTWLGTGKKLPILQQGDVLFGEAGFGKGRTIVLIDGMDSPTTNAHGLYARRSDGDLTESIFFRCIFHWYRSMRLIDLMAVGGSGGHFSPEYFDSLMIPRFPEELKSSIVKLYHNPAKEPPAPSSVSDFVAYHRVRNAGLGIWELDAEMKVLQAELAAVQEKIIQGKTISVPLIELPGSIN